MDFKLPFGKDFRKQISDALRESDVLIVVVGPKWVGTGKRGRLRINEEADQVRIEVETAVNLKIPIIPVLVEGAIMPTSEILPKGLSDFTYLNAAEIDVGRDFDQHMEDLIESIDFLIQDKAALPASVERQDIGKSSPATPGVSKRRREPKEPRKTPVVAPSKPPRLKSAPGVEPAVQPTVGTGEEIIAKIDPPDPPSQAVRDAPPSQVIPHAPPAEEDMSEKANELRGPTSKGAAEGAAPEGASKPESTAEPDTSAEVSLGTAVPTEAASEPADGAAADAPSPYEPKDQPKGPDESYRPAAGPRGGAALEGALHPEEQVEPDIPSEVSSGTVMPNDAASEFADGAPATLPILSEPTGQSEPSVGLSAAPLEQSDDLKSGELATTGKLEAASELEPTGDIKTKSPGPWTRNRFLLAAAAGALIIVLFLSAPKMIELAGHNWSGPPPGTANTEPPAPGMGRSEPPVATGPSDEGGNAPGGDRGQKLAPRVEVCGANIGEPPTGPDIGGPLATVAIKPILSGAKELRTVAFSPDAKIFAIAGDDGKVRLFDASTYTLVRTLARHEDAVYSIVFSSDGSKLASAGWDGTVRVWDVATGAEINRFDAKAQKQSRDHEENKQFAVAFAADKAGKYVLSGGADGMIWIWNLARNNLDRARTGHNDSHHAATVRSLSFAPNGSDEFVSAGNDGTIRFYLPKGGTKKVDAHRGAAFRALFSPTGDRVVSAGYDGKLKIWRTKGQELLKTFDASSKYLVAASWSSDGKRLASSGGDRTIRLWDAESSGTQLLKTFEEQHKEDVEAVAFDPNRNRLLSVSEDKTLKVWDVDSGKSLLTIVGYENGDYLAFDPNGCYAGSPDVERHFKVSIEGFSKDQEITPDMKKALFLQNGFGELKPRK
jgi:WD40 repeat protein